MVSRAYLDNAATTLLDPAVLSAMLPYMHRLCGSPSATHSYGREAKVAVEKARKQVAGLLNVAPAHLFFTSGGTEGNNMVLRGAVEALHIRHVITSPLEHMAVLEPLAQMTRTGYIQCHYVDVDAQGDLQYAHLINLLERYPQALVSLMHGNNEIGNLNDLTRTGEICKTYKAVFHTDAVQTLGHYALDLQKLPVHLLVGSAHKFHGPKGVGIVYVSPDSQLVPLIYGGGQERGMRGGTENVPGIVGLATALEVAYRDMATHQAYIRQLKQHMLHRLVTTLSDVAFHGASHDLEQSLYTLLSVSLPPSIGYEMLLFNLDIQQIAAAAGSACASGSLRPSHVIEALGTDPQRGTVRFSFSKYNTIAEVDYAVETLAQLCLPQATWA